MTQSTDIKSTSSHTTDDSEAWKQLVKNLEANPNKTPLQESALEIYKNMSLLTPPSDRDKIMSFFCFIFLPEIKSAFPERFKETKPATKEDFEQKLQNIKRGIEKISNPRKQKGKDYDPHKQYTSNT